MSEMKKASNNPSFQIAVAAGAAAGMAVDITLFPLDTLKTRLQSARGFLKSGGFRGLYAGLGSVAIGSAPGAAVFFCTYETLKTSSNRFVSPEFQPFLNMAAAPCAEVASCIVRVPTEVIKQRTQANPSATSWVFLKNTLSSEGFYGLYRGYLSTVMREIPFSFIQFPLWEYLKETWSLKQGCYVKSWQSSICGAVAGSIAAGLTTPLDVAKTRIMLAEKGSKASKGNVVNVIFEVYKENSFKGLFAGIIPRVMWMSLGGAIFLGVYEKTKLTLMHNTNL